MKVNHKDKYHVNEINEYYKFACEVCGKMFTTKSTLKNHVKTQHTPSDELCKKCDSVFRTKYLLYQHYPCQIKCPNCDHVFNTKKCLERHLNVHHTKNK